MIAGQLEIQLMADVYRIKKDMDDATRIIGGSMQNIEKAAEFAKQALGGIGIGLGAMELKEMFMSLIEVGDGMASMAERTGIAIKELAAYQLAADQSNTSIDSVAKGVKGLSVFITEHGDRLKQAGIDTNNASTAMRQLADIFAALPDGPTKAALAVKLFGKAGMDLIPMLNLGSKGLEEASEKAEKYAEALAKFAPEAKKFDEAMKEMAMNSQEAKISLMQGVVEGLNVTIEKFREAREAGISFIPALTGFGVRGLNESLPESIRNAGKHIADLNEQIAKAEKDRDNLRQKGDSISAQSYQNDVNRLTNILNFYKRIQREAALAGAAGAYSNEGRGAGVANGNAAKTAKALLGPSDAAKEYDTIVKHISEYNAKLDQEAALGRALTEAEKMEITAKEKLGAAYGVELAASIALAKKKEEEIKVRERAAKWAQEEAKAVQESEGAAYRDLAKAQQNSTKSYGDLIDKLDLETKTMAMTSEERERYIELKKLDREYTIGLIESEDDYKARIEEVNKAFNQRDSIKKQVDLFKSMEQAGHDAFMHIGESGRDTFKRLQDALKNGLLEMLWQMTVKPWIVQIQGQTSGIPGAGSSSGGGLFSGLGDLFSGVFSGGESSPGFVGPPSSLMSFAGGGYTGDGSRSGGLDGQGGFLAMMHPREDVVDRTRGGSGGAVSAPSVSVTQHISIDSRSDQATIVAAMVQTKNATIAAIRDAQRRGS